TCLRVSRQTVDERASLSASALTLLLSPLLLSPSSEHDTGGPRPLHHTGRGGGETEEREGAGGHQPGGRQGCDRSLCEGSEGEGAAAPPPCRQRHQQCAAVGQQLPALS